jgi:CRP/FNR family transcriptional regulator, cyclic AMP receptor protein
MSTIVSNLDLLRRVPIFSLLTTAQAEALAHGIVKRRFKRGELIVEQGKKSNALFIILAGRARVVASNDKGREVILAALVPGDYVGEMSLIDSDPHSATVCAEIQTDTLVLGRAEFMQCISEGSAIAHQIMKGLVKRLRQADRKIESLALMDVYGRVAHALLELAEPDLRTQAPVVAKISRQDLAKIVGASREMVSRVMKDLEERGFIETRGDGAMELKEHLHTLR